MIKILPKHVVDKIAAGEVVDRPASIVKELVENSIDAQATSVIVELVAGGKTEIVVRDNGDGIIPGDLGKVFIKHATSKISQFEDLQHIRSFGFRGEALASISAVADVEVLSKREETQGMRICVRDGVLEPAPRERGTTVLVRRIFDTIPARKAFLKSDQAEYRRIRTYLTMQALVYPHISFQLIHNQTSQLHIPACANFQERITEIYGSDVMKRMVWVDHTAPSVSVTGCVSQPQQAVKRNPIRTLLVNNRVVSDDTVAMAVYIAFKPLLMSGKKPEYVLNLFIDTEKLDVNIHPQKKEVRFQDKDLIFRAVKSAVEEAMSKTELRTRVDLGSSKNEMYSHPSPQPLMAQAQQTAINWMLNDSSATPIPLLQSHSIAEERLFIENQSLKATHRLIGQIHNSYLLVESKQGMLMIDQHAAHEKINYNHLKTMYESGNTEIQQLAIPEMISLSLEQLSSYEHTKKELHQLGFETNMVGERDVAIYTLPLFLSKKINLKSCIIAFLQNQHEDTPSGDALVDRWASMSCRMSVMFGDVLGFSEQQKLVDDFFELDFEYCPHGRPVVIELTLGDLDLYFKRKV